MSKKSFAVCALLALIVACQHSFRVTGFTIPRQVPVRFRTASAPFRSRADAFDRSIPQSASLATEGITSSSLGQVVLQKMESSRDKALEFADMFALTPAEAAFYSLFAAIREAVPLGLKGQPFVLRHAEIEKAMHQESQWPGFFTMKDLEKALSDDFLDAARGSTDNRKGWQITDVSVPRGQSFEEARMTFQDVQAALEKGTVIFNAAGAHIPKLAGPSLACTESTLLPCALNLYVTDAGKRTSAPPHTDKQDVAVVQTSGRKHWKVYSPPNPAMKPTVDIFARGKGDDSLPLYILESDLGCQLLLETTLNPGDVMFVPAAFPHTTSTVTEDDSTHADKTSIHLTLGIDHHIWELDYLCCRRLALRRANVKDTALGQTGEEDSPYIGAANEVTAPLINDLFAELPLGLLGGVDYAAPVIEHVAAELERISREVDETTASAVGASVWREAVERLRTQGMELLDIHRDMYLAALEEGQIRDEEAAMTAHLGQAVRRAMTPERMQRLSLFRVKRYFDQIDASKKALQQWSYARVEPEGEGDLADNWALTMPVKVGDQVEADLGGAFFPATVSRASGGTFDVNFFDGDRETGLERNQIKLLAPPAPQGDINTSNMTPKQLKRWKKQQEKTK